MTLRDRSTASRSRTGRTTLALWVKDSQRATTRSLLTSLSLLNGCAAELDPRHRLVPDAQSATTLTRLPSPRTSRSRIQRRIAASLAAFDELIEINERRIELLEDLARSLYREWFVRFRFPGHESARARRLRRSGAIPDGWRVGPVDVVRCEVSHASPVLATERGLPTGWRIGSRRSHERSADANPRADGAR